jgi:hypothetical protein
MKHRLIGLETDNLLGFLALLGLLRALDRARPAWGARAYFQGAPLSALLEISANVTQEDVAEAASEGACAFAQAFEFEEFADLAFDGPDARRLLQGARTDDLRSSVLSALCSDAALRMRNKEERIIPTPLCAMFGQGHQHFLSRLGSVARSKMSQTIKGKKSILPLDSPTYIQRALFAPWTRSDATDSFRWDHSEDRRYALRYADPSGDAPRTEHGATRLAILGLLSFQSAPTLRGQYPDLRTRGFSRDKRTRAIRVTWPIWSVPATLNAIHAMLDDPELYKDDPTLSRLERFSIEQLRRACRISNGKFLSFTRAAAIT